MSRFLAWFTWEWRDHAKLVIGCALGAVFLTWVALLLGRSAMGLPVLEGVLVGELALVALVLAAGLFGSERRHGAESLLLRTPGARLPLFLARLAFFGTALAAVALVVTFGAARLAVMEGGARSSLPSSSVGWFLWPRYIAADALVLAVAMGCVGALVSAWTKRVALAFVLGVVLPALVLFPWIYLGAARGDFFPFYRLGAIPLAAWPLLVLALVALGFSWLLGRRRLNRPRRAPLYGTLVLLLGMGVAGAWTAQAFATFDEVRADAQGFRMENYPIRLRSQPSLHRMHSGLPLESVALSSDGRMLWVQGFRRDAGRWPYHGPSLHGPEARDFREDRGTWSRQWRIDLETGMAAAVGDVGDRLSWYDLGSGDFRGLLRGVDMRARLAPRAHAVLGSPGDSDEAGILDLNTGAFLGRPLGSLDWAQRRELGRQVVASGTGVRDAQGRSTWLEYEAAVSAESATIGGMPHVYVATPTSRSEVGDKVVRALSNLYTNTWSAVPGGWSRISGKPRFVTIDAATARVRKSTAEQGRVARGTRYGHAFFLDVRSVLVTVGRGQEHEWSYRLLDLETGKTGPTLVGPAAQLILPVPTLDGRLLCLQTTESGRRFMLWSPRTDEKALLRLDGADKALSADAVAALLGADLRGNMVLSFFPQTREVQLGHLLQRTLLFRASTGELLTIDRPPALTGNPRFHAIGIDAADRVVGLADHDGNGYRTVERFDPEDASRTVLFPKSK